MNYRKNLAFALLMLTPCLARGLEIKPADFSAAKPEGPYEIVAPRAAQPPVIDGDLGDPAAAKYDIEAWLPGQNQYRETHSTSNDTDFQSRRLNIKYRKKTTGKNEYVHTLNGTALAIGRIIIAIMENYQQKDGTIKTPDALKPLLSL